MAGLNTDEIRKILDALGDDSILFCQIRTANFEVVLSVDGNDVGGMATQLSLEPTPLLPDLSVRTTPSPGASMGANLPGGSVTVESSNADEAKESFDLPAHAMAVSSPMPGTFYRASDPAAPPFVEVGARVTPDSTVALIEAMKVFSAVRAGIAGTVLRIEANNDAFVEYGATLMWIAPDV